MELLRGGFGTNKYGMPHRQQPPSWPCRCWPCELRDLDAEFEAAWTAKWGADDPSRKTMTLLDYTK